MFGPKMDRVEANMVIVCLATNGMYRRIEDVSLVKASIHVQNRAHVDLFSLA